MSNGTEERRRTATAVGAPKRPKPIRELDGVSADDRERMARFLDAMVIGYETEAAHISNLMASGQDWPGAYNQMVWSRTAASVLKQLAHIVRTAKGGPLHGTMPKGGRPKKSQQ